LRTGRAEENFPVMKKRPAVRESMRQTFGRWGIRGRVGRLAWRITGPMRVKAGEFTREAEFVVRPQPRLAHD
jgi:hypothetical protein